MKKAKIIIGIFSILILVSCQNYTIPEQPKFKTLMIKSSGKIETLPDIVTFSISLNCLKKTVKSSKDCLVKKSNELNAKLLSFNIDQDDILTTSVNLNKSYRWRYNTQVFEGYNSSTRLFVTVRNINKLDEIYTELLENQNLNLSGLSYSHSKLDSLKNEAYVDALKNADILADKLIDELPEKEKEILKLGNVKISASLPNVNESKYEVDYEIRENNNTSSNNSISISKGTVIVNATLFVEYRIK